MAMPCELPSMESLGSETSGCLPSCERTVVGLKFLSLGSIILLYPLVPSNIAGWKILYEWRVLIGKSLLNGPFSIAMFDYQKVSWYIDSTSEVLRDYHHVISSLYM